ncbi:cobalt-precorrin-5B (C(1))-methyltransferase [Candidatus Puniceispirillum sp.]|uniref:cobalt-precorrin-5B (C(1))-methyltransferase n=1 Tax=Candidatus Puniceispirillum sp. TaxID=2026719 RepID=UPI003F6A3955
MTPTLSSNLRFGWTTGTCASAAVNASYMALLTGEFPDRVTIVTPSGKNADLEIAKTSLGAGWACAGVVKDAGDDPDVTHGAMICATVRLGAPDSGVVFRQGAGVGVITKPGLPIDVGEPAINPVPRQMMCAVIDDLATSLGGTGDVEIEISVPDGDKIALKTWNPRLGIEGGISILGTTGVVRPFSCSAWIASIHRGIDVARANALPHVIGSTGATSEGFAKKCYDLPDIALLDMGDFVGGMLKYMRKNPVPRLTIAGGFGKLVKMAQGAVDLHSARSQVDFEKLALLAEPLGFRHDAVAHANSVLEIVQMADLEQRHALATLIAEQALDAAMAYLKRDDIAIEIFVVSRDGALLGRAGRLEL